MSESSGNFLFWIQVTHFVPKLGFILTTLFGSLLLLLNYLGAQKNFGSYKYLISAFTILGMVFSAVEILVYPNVHNYKAGFLFFSFQESFGLTSSWSRNIPLAGYTFFHSATMSLLSVHFIYRYWAVFDTNKLNYFQGIRSLIWFGYCTFFGFQYALGTYFFLARDEIITTPTIILFIPITIIMILPIMNLDISLPTGVFLCSFTLYPATDSMTVMYVVSEYKNTAKRIHKVFGNGIKEIQVSRISSTINPASTAPSS
ncbi:Protein CBG04853 [Caenorhabditis briggsae]|uniref:Protein CBG04853 n=1 Tax=Caenorhabditis briggsae TaxID=6238 RepID=A8WYM5_CAEBR|nr:Protein CBG04853 [Caenorhabditis briggsae]CAP25483.2 Protein CBG04853 [Caenorhabditis briggsae]